MDGRLGDNIVNDNRDSILLNIQNNTTQNQNVVLFDCVGAEDATNALVNNINYQWNFSGLLGLYQEIKITATPKGGVPTNYIYINPSGNLNTITDIINGLNTLGIGQFYQVSANVVGVYGSANSYTYQNLQMYHVIQFQWAFNLLGTRNINLTASGLDGNVYWGDGSITSLTLANAHTYAKTGTYNISIEYDGSITQLYVDSNSLTYFNPTITLPSTLQQLDISVNALTSFNPTVALPAGLQILDLQGNALTSFNPTVALPAGLQDLYVDSNNLTSFAPTIPLPAGLINLGVSLNNLNTASVNAALEYLDGEGYSAPFTAILTQLPAAPPSGAGITAKNNLIGRGCTIVTD